MANSSLATYTKLTANNSGPRTKKAGRITIHYMAGRQTGKWCADYFYSEGQKANGRRASSNYCVGYNGDIAVSVNESNRAWTSSSEWNDQQAVTIECGNESDTSLSDACYNSLIKLCADICKRNGITPHYTGDSDGTLTEHRMFAATSCPGTWIHKKLADGTIEKDILAAMGKSTTTTKTAASASDNLYRVRKTWADSKSQIGAYSVLDNARKACKAGYSVYNSKGTKLYQVTSASGTIWDYEAVLYVGDTVCSKSVAIEVIPGTSSAIKGDYVYAPKLCPDTSNLIPLADVSESSDTDDGAQDDYLANTDAKICLEPCKVVAITDEDISANIVQVKGFVSGKTFKVVADKLGKKLN